MASCNHSVPTAYDGTQLSSMIVLSRHAPMPILLDLLLESINPAHHGVWLELLLRLDGVPETSTPTLPGIFGNNVGDGVWVYEVRSSSDVVQQSAKVYQAREKGDASHRLNVLMSNNGFRNAFRLVLCSYGTLLPVLQQIKGEVTGKEFIAEAGRRNVLVRGSDVMQHGASEPGLVQLPALLQTPFGKAFLCNRYAIRVDTARVAIGVGREFGLSIVVNARAEWGRWRFQVLRRDRLGRFGGRGQFGLVCGDG